MKKTALLIFFATYNLYVFAQNTVTTKATDSIKANKLSPSTLKITDGAAMLPANDITTNIARSKELSAFYNAIQLAGLNETFKSKGPITVFAPLNPAFNSMPAGKLDTLLKPAHKYDLIALITYHALPGIVTAHNIARQISQNKGTVTFITLTGNKLTAKIDANRNIILIDENGGQCIISKFDIKQNNGLIHLVNAVLVPKVKNI